MKTKSKTLSITLFLGVLLWSMIACGISPRDTDDRLIIPTSTIAENTLTEVEPDQSALEPTPAKTACAIQESHPIGKSISETYQVSYEQVMTWNCEGYPFEDILIALETSSGVDLSAETLLKMSLEKDWDTIWKEIGFTN